MIGVKETDNEKLDQNVLQNYNEVTSEMISMNNADLLSQMVNNNKIRDSIILEQITAKKQHENEELVGKTQPGLDLFLRDDDEIDHSSFKRRRSKCLAELNEKFSSTKIKTKSLKLYLKKKL